MTTLDDVLAVWPGRERGTTGYAGPCPKCDSPTSLHVTPTGGQCVSELCGTSFGLRSLLDRYGGTATYDDGPIFHTLAELQANPEMLKPPEAVVPYFGFRGRLVLLAGGDKSGKSSVMSAAVSRLSKAAPFLGAPTRGNRAVWLGLEEATADAVRRFVRTGTCPENVQVVGSRHPPNLLEHVDGLLETWPADLVVLDSLSEYARVVLGMSPGDGDNAQWGAVIRPLAELARRRNVAVVVIHHTRKSDGSYRGPTELAAAADCLLELRGPSNGENPTTRHVSGRGRWAVEPFSFSLDDDGDYRLGSGGELSLDAVVLLFIQDNPGSSQRKIRQSVTGRAQTVDAAVNRLVQRGAIQDRPNSRGSAFYVTATTQISMTSTSEVAA